MLILSPFLSVVEKRIMSSKSSSMDANPNYVLKVCSESIVDYILSFNLIYLMANCAGALWYHMIYQCKIQSSGECAKMGNSLFAN